MKVLREFKVTMSVLVEDVAMAATYLDVAQEGLEEALECRMDEAAKHLVEELNEGQETYQGMVVDVTAECV